MPPTPPNLVADIENQTWYTSTQGPQVSTTVKSVALLVVPIVQNLFHVSTSIGWIDSLIDVLCIAGFGGYALYGYIRAKKTLGATISYYKIAAARSNSSNQTPL